MARPSRRRAPGASAALCACAVAALLCAACVAAKPRVRVGDVADVPDSEETDEWREWGKRREPKKIESASVCAAQATRRGASC